MRRIARVVTPVITMRVNPDIAASAMTATVQAADATKFRIGSGIDLDGLGNNLR